MTKRRQFGDNPPCNFPYTRPYWFEIPVKRLNKVKMVTARRRLLILFGLTACVLLPGRSQDATSGAIATTVGLIAATTLNPGMIWVAPKYAF
jgi:hypothetical protein